MCAWEKGRMGRWKSDRSRKINPFPNLPVGRNKQVAKKKLLEHMTGGRTTRQVQVYPGITGFNRDMAAKGKPFGKQGCNSGPSLIPGECYIIPGLAFSLGVLERCRMIPLEGPCWFWHFCWFKCASVSLFLLSLLASAAPVSMQHMKMFVFVKYKPTDKQCICSTHASLSGKGHLH